jgi:TldD protein
MTSRRDFLKIGSAVAARVGLGRATIAGGMLYSPTSAIDATPRAGDPELRDLAMRALDAAKSAGAAYADVRLTVTRTQSFFYGGPPSDTETIAVGVRALVDGFWGFAASPLWTPDEMARLARDVVAQAKDNAWPGTSRVDLGQLPTVATGTWMTPVKRDPFAVAVEEKLDFIRSVHAFGSSLREAGCNSIIVFERQERTFASTDGGFVTQTLYNSLGNGSFLGLSVNDPVTRRFGYRTAPFVSPTSAGYEVFEDSGVLDLIPRMYDEARQMLTAEGVEPLRYDVVFDGVAMAGIVDETIGAALEVDRALGLEANAGGTSYLAPAEKILGTQIAPSMLTVTANRSQPTGAATVKWDDDGVEPEQFSLVSAGQVVDYATSREHVAALGPWYQSKGKPLRSHGCSGSGDAMNVPIIHSPNLAMQPAAQNVSMDDLIAGIDDGYAVFGGSLHTDQQKLTGQGRGELVYRIKKGKRVGTVDGMGYAFRSPDFWKNLTGIGGAQTAVMRGITASKGQPLQETAHSVSAVPARFRNVAVVDLRAKPAPSK